jgi:hypothetical protein
MKPARAEALADILAEIATRLEQAEGKGRESAARNLPGSFAKDAALVDVFVAVWLRGAASEAVRGIRDVTEQMRPRRRRRS